MVLWVMLPVIIWKGQLYVRGETWNNSGNASWTNYSDIRLKDVSGVFGRGLLEILAFAAGALSL